MSTYYHAMKVQMDVCLLLTPYMISCLIRKEKEPIFSTYWLTDKEGLAMYIQAGERRD